MLSLLPGATGVLPSSLEAIPPTVAFPATNAVSTSLASASSDRGATFSSSLSSRQLQAQQEQQQQQRQLQQQQQLLQSQHQHQNPPGVDKRCTVVNIPWSHVTNCTQITGSVLSLSFLVTAVINDSNNHASSNAVGPHMSRSSSSSSLSATGAAAGGGMAGVSASSLSLADLETEQIEVEVILAPCPATNLALIIAHRMSMCRIRNELLILARFLYNHDSVMNSAMTPTVMASSKGNKDAAAKPSNGAPHNVKKSWTGRFV